MRTILSLLASYFMPYSCYFCQSRSVRLNDLCEDCEKTLFSTNLTCVQCCRIFISSSSSAESQICGSCLKMPPLYTKLVCIGPYQNELRHLIIQFKFYEKLFIGQLLSKLLAQKISSTYSLLPECLIPVPLHKKRLTERGFNQAQEIARVLSKKLSIPLDYHLCVRQRNTKPQSELSGKERKHNIKNAFILRKQCPYQHIAIIDDVLTTGDTVQELAKIFLNQGAKKVDIWCLARR